VVHCGMKWGAPVTNGYHQRNIKVSRTEAYGWGNGQYNYSAIDDDTYDGPGSLIGFGSTPEKAKLDLELQIADSKLD
jgi:hypothetical protein